MVTLEYASGTKAPPPRWVYGLVLVLGGWPAVAGVGITVLYLVTWWSVLPALGVLCILAGLLSVGTGAILLTIYGLGQLRYAVRPKRAVWREIGGGMLLLILNFPLAAGCLAAGANESEKVQVNFVNEMGQPVTAVTLISNGVPTLVGDLPAKSQRKLTMRVTPEAEFKGSANMGGAATEFMVDPYPEGGPMRKTVRFQTPATRPVVE